ncbi:MAG TPA: hypothetical protein VIU40_00385 [Geobacteraceae bacterium]
MDTSDPKPQLDADLARRLHRALTAGKDELFQVAEDPSPAVLRALLKNPQLDENHLQALLKRRDLSEEYLRSVYGIPMVESSHLLKVALVRNPGTPTPVVLALLPHLHLFELVNICYLPGATADQKLVSERAIIQRLPTTPLGAKITLARRATSVVVDALLQEGDKRLMEPCLNNGSLKEAAVFRFLSGPRANAETISFVARHPKWKARPNLRLAILKNNHTPVVWYSLFLPGIPVGELRNLLASQRLTPVQRQAIRDEGKRRGLG